MMMVLDSFVLAASSGEGVGVRRGSLEPTANLPWRDRLQRWFDLSVVHDGLVEELRVLGVILEKENNLHVQVSCGDDEQCAS
jgi:hypothetical protein